MAKGIADKRVVAWMSVYFAVRAMLKTNHRAFDLWMCMLSYADRRSGLLYPGDDLLREITGLNKCNFSRELAVLKKLGLVEDAAKTKKGRYQRIIPQRFLHPKVEQGSLESAFCGSEPTDEEAF